MSSDSPAVLVPDAVFDGDTLRRNVAVEVDGGRVRALRPARSGEGLRLGGKALFPGLVNAHSHAFQRLIRGRTEYVASGRESDDFWSWRELMYQAAGALSPEDVFVASRQAFIEMARAGITAVGEFHYLHHQPDGTPYADRNELGRQVIRAALEVGIRICLLRVGYARPGFNAAPNPRQKRFYDPDPETFLASADALRTAYAGEHRVSVGLAPHSVRAVPRSWLEAVSQRQDLVHMHVAEQPAEIAACMAEHGRRPLQLLSDLGLLTERFTGVHAIHLEAGEIEALGRARANVCACPSTERNLGDGVVPADALVRAGVQLSFGSDSQATIDLLDEARELESHLRLVRLKRAVLDPGGGSPSGLAARLFQMATVGGARSLGLEGGGLRPGRPADLFTVDLAHPALAGADDASLLPTLVFGAPPGAIRDVAVAGRFIVRDGVHPLEAESGSAFSALSRRIFS